MKAFELGASIQMEELDGDPYPILAQLRELEPVSWCQSLGGWLVTDRDLAREVLNDERRFSARSDASMNLRILGNQMLNLDREEHRRHRQPFNPHLRIGPVRERYSEMIEKIVDELVDGFAELGAGDLRTAFARVLPVRVSATVLGLSGEDTAAIGDWYDDFGQALSNYERDPVVDDRARLSNEALRRRVLADLRSPVPGSLISSVCGVDAGGLDQDEVLGNLGIILFGGIETTEASILNTLWALVADPEQLAEVRARPELVENALDEALRWEAPTQIVDRWATAATALGGIPIGTGDWVNVMIGAVNRDPSVFPDPDRYDVHRANARRHMAFGHGPHSCIGLNVAKLEAQTALRVLLARLPGLRLDSSPAEPPRGIAFRKPPRLNVAWDIGHG